MTKTISSNTNSSSLADVRAKIEHVPLIRRHGCVFSFLTLLVIYGFFLLLAHSPPVTAGLALIILFNLLLLVWAIIRFTDEVKPEIMKTVIAFV